MEVWQRRRILGSWFHIGWQRDKADRNVRKHAVTFEEAMTVLDDPRVLAEPHVEAGEDREKLIGASSSGRRLAVVVFIWEPGLDDGAEETGSIRIISARRATPAEEALYKALSKQQPAPPRRTPEGDKPHDDAIETSDIPDTAPDARLGTLRDAIERARARARQRPGGTPPPRPTSV